MPTVIQNYARKWAAIQGWSGSSMAQNTIRRIVADLQVKRPFRLSLFTNVSGMNDAHRNKSNPLFKNKVEKYMYLNEVNKRKTIIQ